jgi:hypothetical protein
MEVEERGRAREVRAGLRGAQAGRASEGRHQCDEANSRAPVISATATASALFAGRLSSDRRG